MPQHVGEAIFGQPRTALVLNALAQDIWTRQQDGITELAGLVHHTDPGGEGGGRGRCRRPGYAAILTAYLVTLPRVLALVASAQDRG